MPSGIPEGNGKRPRREYLATTRAANRKGSIGLWAFVAFLLVGYLGGLAQVPPSATAVAVAGLLASAISLPWIWWFDRNRELRPSPAAAAASAAAPGAPPPPRG